MKNRAFAMFEIKAFDDDKRIVEGIATTPTTDRMLDIMEPLGAKFESSIPFLWQHRHDQPIGETKLGKPTKDGIPFVSRVMKAAESQSLIDRLDEAWESLKLGLVKAVSIGFNPTEWTFLDNGGIRWLEYEIYELSAVTIPANPDAVITELKSLQGGEAAVTRMLRRIDAELREREGVPEPELPEAPAKQAALGKALPVVRLDDTARVRAPFVIKKVHPLKRG